MGETKSLGARLFEAVEGAQGYAFVSDAVAHLPTRKYWRPPASPLSRRTAAPASSATSCGRTEERPMPETTNLHKRVANEAALPSTVHCPHCGAQEDVNPSYCLAHGWPRCCGLTMHLGPRPDDA